METEMRSITEDIRLCIQELRRKVFVLLLTALIGLITGIVASQFVNGNVYQASVCIYNAEYSSYYETTAITHFLQNAQTLSQSRKVAESAAQLLGDGYTADEVQGSVKLSQEEDSSVVWISCESPVPVRAIEMVNAFTESLVNEIKLIAGADSVQILEYAQSARMVSNLSTTRLLIMVLIPMAFVTVACLIITLRLLLSSRILSLDRCTLNGQINLLGVIPEISKGTGENENRST